MSITSGTRPILACRLPSYLKSALIFTACLAWQVSAAPQPEAQAGAEPEYDMVFERGSGKPYDPNNNARKQIEMQRQNLLRMSDTGAEAELEKLGPGQRLFAETRIEQMRGAITQARAEEATRKQLAEADWNASSPTRKSGTKPSSIWCGAWLAWASRRSFCWCAIRGRIKRIKRRRSAARAAA